MHSFLRSIGFSNLSSRQEEEQLISIAVENAQEKQLYTEKERRFAELSYEIAPDVGIVVRGEYDNNNQFHVEHYFPYVRGRNVSTNEEIYISKRVDTDAYTGMCDDFRLGVSLIFYLQNAVDYMKVKDSRDNFAVYHPITLSGMAQEGKILLPVKKDKEMEKIMDADLSHRSHLISEAKRGNQDAIEDLTLGDIDMYSMVCRRIKNEDVYSIVDTSLIPYGSESDNFTVLAIIKEVRSVHNDMSGEDIYILLLSCNLVDFEICINCKDLLGEPKPGRRFRGNVWMQGNVDFNA